MSASRSKERIPQQTRLSAPFTYSGHKENRVNTPQEKNQVIFVNRLNGVYVLSFSSLQLYQQQRPQQQRQGGPREGYG